MEVEKKKLTKIIIESTWDFTLIVNILVSREIIYYYTVFYNSKTFSQTSYEKLRNNEQIFAIEIN